MREYSARARVRISARAGPEIFEDTVRLLCSPFIRELFLVWLFPDNLGKNACKLRFAGHRKPQALVSAVEGHRYEGITAEKSLSLQALAKELTTGLSSIGGEEKREISKVPIERSQALKVVKFRYRDIRVKRKLEIYKFLDLASSGFTGHRWEKQRRNFKVLVERSFNAASSQAIVKMDIEYMGVKQSESWKHEVL